METSTLIVRVDEKQIRSVVMQAVAEALQATQSQHYSKKAAAKYLKISAVTLWSYERQQLLHPVKVGGRMMFLKSELDRFASGQKC